MTLGRLFSLTALIALALAACSKNSTPSPPPVSASTDTASTPSAAMVRADGSPQIVTEPDGVHIEYRTYGKGDPAVILIHGWATDANYWNAQFDPLKAKY